MEQASTPAFMSTLFPPELRYTAISLSYNVSMAVIGGLSPLFGQLYASNLSIAYLLMGSSIIAILIYQKYPDANKPTSAPL